MRFSGKSGTGEVGNSVRYEISDRNSVHVITGALAVGSDGTFSTDLDLSSLDDGMISYSAFVIDSLSNVGGIALSTVGKSVVPASGNVTFLSGAYVDSSDAVIRIAAEKTVDYEVTGDVV